MKFSVRFLLGCICLSAVSVSVRAAEETIDYETHVRPIFREHCLSCHNSQSESGGLALDSYGRTMSGGAGGEVVFGGDLEGSRLWMLVNHEDEPAMPPNQDRIADEKLAILRRWIEQGALERPGSSPPPAANPLAMAALPEPATEGEAILPERVPKQAILTSATRGAILGLAASPRGPVLAAAVPRQVVLFHFETGDLLGILPFPEGIPQRLRFSRDGSMLVAGGGRGGASGIVALYDVRSGKRLATLGEALDAVLACDLHAGRGLAAFGGPDRCVAGWNLTGNTPLFEIRKHTDWITDLEFSPNGRFLATADRQGGLTIWEAETGLEYQSLQGHPAAVTSVSWRPDSGLLATSSEDGTLKLWGTEQPNPVQSWDAHAGGVLHVVFDRQGRLASSGRDRYAKLWNADGNLATTFPELADAALAVAVSLDGARVAMGDWKGNLRVHLAAGAQQVLRLDPQPQRLEQQLAVAEAKRSELEGQATTEAEAAERLVGESATLRGQLDQVLGEILALPAEPPEGEAAELLGEQRAALEQKAGRMAAQLLRLETEAQAASARSTDRNQQLDAARQVVARVQAELGRLTEIRTALDADLEAANARQRTAAEAQQRAAERLQALQSLHESAQKVAADATGGGGNAPPKSDTLISPEFLTNVEQAIQAATEGASAAAGEVARCQQEVQRAIEARDAFVQTYSQPNS